MPGIDAQDGWLYVSKTDDGDEFMRLVGLLGEFGAEIEGWPTERVRAVLRSERYFHAIHYPRAIHIHPLNYALGLAAAAERAGARIFEHTPALSIDPAGVRKRIVTPSARLRANHVVLCGNVQIASLMPRVASALIPVTTYVITTAPLGPRLTEAIDYRGAVSDSDLADNHYRIVGGDRLMWSGRATTWAQNPRRYVRALTADIKQTYPQLGDVAVDYAWSGTLGNSIHRMPQIGELGPGLWLASGFGGHGLNTTAMAGNLIARAIVDGDQTWRQFTPFELVWAGGILGRATVQMYYWISGRAMPRPSAAPAPPRRRIAARAKPKSRWPDARSKPRRNRTPGNQDAPDSVISPPAAMEPTADAEMPPSTLAAAQAQSQDAARRRESVKALRANSDCGNCSRGAIDVSHVGLARAGWDWREWPGMKFAGMWCFTVAVVFVVMPGIAAAADLSAEAAATASGGTGDIRAAGTRLDRHTRRRSPDAPGLAGRADSEYGLPGLPLFATAKGGRSGHFLRGA